MVYPNMDRPFLLFPSNSGAPRHHWTTEFDRPSGCWGIRLPQWKNVGLYISGALFAIGCCLFLDAIINARYVTNHSIRVNDWIGCVLTTLGMMFVNSIDQSCLSSTEYLYSGSRLSLRKARLLLFIGLVFMSWGICWSASNFVIYYIIPRVEFQIWHFGLMMLLQSVFTMLSTIVFWVSQSGEDYRL